MTMKTLANCNVEDPGFPEGRWGTRGPRTGPKTGAEAALQFLWPHFQDQTCCKIDKCEKWKSGQISVLKTKLGFRKVVTLVV